MADKTINLTDRKFPFTIAGRDMEMFLPTEAQIMVLSSASARAEKVGMNSMAALPHVGKMMDILQANIVDPVDQVWIEDEVLARRINIDDLVSMVEALMAEAEGLVAEYGSHKQPKGVRRAARGK